MPSSKAAGGVLVAGVACFDPLVQPVTPMTVNTTTAIAAPRKIPCLRRSFFATLRCPCFGVIVGKCLSNKAGRDSVVDRRP